MPGEPLPHLETFAKAAEASSFTVAAGALGLSQAAVSQRIQALEKAVGVALFRRKAGHVILTDAGRRLYAFAQRILALHQEALASVSGQKTPVSGELTLAARSIPGEHLLPQVLSLFVQEYPHLHFRATIADSLEVIDLVEHGKAHLGLVGRKNTNPQLEFRCFACDKMVLIVPAKHSLSRRRRITLRQLRQHPLILREAGSGSRWCFEQA